MFFKMTARLRRYDLGMVLAGDRLVFNTNNHWEESGPPADYQAVLEQTRTKHWVHLFHRQVPTLTLDQEDLRWLTLASRSGMIANRFPHAYDEELAATCLKHASSMATINAHRPPQGWFIRSERVSLKCGLHGAGPYFDLEPILQSIVTTRTPIFDEL